MKNLLECSAPEMDSSKLVIQFEMCQAAKVLQDSQ
jgi:hypothetical protein